MTLPLKQLDFSIKDMNLSFLFQKLLKFNNLVRGEFTLRKTLEK